MKGIDKPVGAVTITHTPATWPYKTPATLLAHIGTVLGRERYATRIVKLENNQFAISSQYRTDKQTQVTYLGSMK